MGMKIAPDSASERGKYFICKNTFEATIDGEEAKLTEGEKYQIIQHFRDDKDFSKVFYVIHDDDGKKVSVKDSHFDFYDHDFDGNAKKICTFAQLIEMTRRLIASAIGFFWACLFLSSFIVLKDAITVPSISFQERLVSIIYALAIMTIMPIVALYCYRRKVGDVKNLV